MQSNGQLVNPGDTLVVVTGPGVWVPGVPADVLATLAIGGTFASAIIAIEGLPTGTPLVQGNPPTPVSPSAWVPIGQLPNGSQLINPVGPLSGPATYSIVCAGLMQVRLRLVSIGSGSIQGSIVTVPPVPVTMSDLLLELQRLRMGMTLLLAECTDGADLAGAVPALLPAGN